LQKGLVAMFRKFACVLLVVGLLLAACTPGKPSPSQEIVVSPSPIPSEIPAPTETIPADDKSPEGDPLTFTTTMRIHESLPEFTFHRIVGDFVLETRDVDIPQPREVTIIIEDEEGNIIQTISDLTENHYDIDVGIEFADFNFDGYLDMRLVRWSDSGESLRQVDYIWLWDTDEFQFVLNEQLMEIDSAGITANKNTLQIEAWIKYANGAKSSFYEYINGELTLVASERTLEKYDDSGQFLHWEITRTNEITKEITIEISP
jgi:hypothetical protein